MLRISHPFAGTIGAREFLEPLPWALCLLLLGSVPGLRSVLRAEPRAVQLLSVKVQPPSPTLSGPKATQRFLVVGEYSDGLQRDLTAQAQFAVSDPKVAEVAPSGQVLARHDGDTTLTVSVKGFSIETKLRIQDTNTDRPFSFARDIGGILTKHGCNDSTCHGGVKGQGGLKLSLNALYPRDDYRWLVEGGTFSVLSTDTGLKNPRIDRQDPGKSLLLTKPSGEVAHGGGQRFGPGSPEYQTILDWVREGAPYGEENDEKTAKVERVEVFPKEVALSPGGSHRLLVTAVLSNGRREDISDRVLYVSNNVEVVKADSEGVLTAVRPGETSILIRSAGYAVAVVAGVIAAAVPDYPDVPKNNFIDEFVFTKLRKFNLIPSPLSSDAEFLRRVCLDLTGTMPPPERVREFVNDKDPGKRQKIVDVLLNTPEYVDYWTFRFAELFRVAWLQNGIKAQWSEAYWEWIRDNVAKNKPYDQVAQQRISAVGGSPASRHFLPIAEVRKPENKMAEEIRVFWGRRLDCAQCHNHPFEAWSQDQFWGLASFFGRMNLINGRGEEFGTVIFEDPTGQEVDLFEKGKSRKVRHPRTKEEVPPTFLDGTVLTEEKQKDLRRELANWVVSHPYFAEAATNRVWGYFFGRGIVDPVDDFRSTNPPTHPDLLQALAAYFRENGHDLKGLMRVIVNSRTYQLSSAPNETNQDDKINYSHFVPRLMDAEVLFDAISSATGVPQVYEQNRGERGILPAGTRAIQVKMPDLFESRVLRVYGADQSRIMVPEGSPHVNLGQALHQLAGVTFTEHLRSDEGHLATLIASGKSDDELIDEAYLLTLSRFPTGDEKSALTDLLAGSASRRAAFEDLFWALIASMEFSTNH